MQYDGSGKLGAAIADLCGLSPKSQAQIAVLIKQAKDGLGIISKAKRLPDDMKLNIYRWHYDRLNFVQHVIQDDSIQDRPIQSLPNAIVQDVKQSDDDKLDLLPDNPVQYIKQDDVYHVKNTDDIQNVKQDALAQTNDDHMLDGSVYDYDQVHFGVTITHRGHSKRTTVMLEGYLVKALQRKHDLADNTAIRAWIEQAIKDADDTFDSNAPLTKQVKRLIVESFV